MAKQSPEKSDLLGLLTKRLNIAKKYTENFHDEVKRCVKDYELESSKSLVDQVNNINARYEFKIPYIQATHESYMASIFNRPPDLIIRNRGKYDEEKQKKILATYEYLKDKLDLATFTHETAHWFVLTGWTSAHASFVSEIEEVDGQDPETGEPLLDEMGEVIKVTNYKYNDPVITVGDPLREYFSPESEFSIDGKKIPHSFRSAKMSVDEIEKVYGVKVAPDSELDVDVEDDAKDRGDLERATVYFYYGTLPSSHKSAVKEVTWDADRLYYFIFTKSKVLHAEAINEKPCRYQRWYHTPNKFFGYGLGKTLRESQMELNIRRGQQIKYADLLSNPKLAYEIGTEIDLSAWQDPRATVGAGYKENPPQWIAPPPISETVMLAEQKAREDAQFISGLLDLNKGAQDAVTVKTATGQSIFAQAAERKVERVKQLYFHFYKSMVIYLLKLCRDNWEEEKLVYITDEDPVTGNEIAFEMKITAQDLSDIDLDSDIDFDVENISVNKDALRAQSIELYDMAKQEMFVDRKKMFKKLLREVWNEKNPDQFILDPMAQQQQDMEMGMGMPPAPMGDVPMSNSGLMGANVQA